MKFRLKENKIFDKVCVVISPEELIKEYKNYLIKNYQKPNMWVINNNYSGECLVQGIDFLKIKQQKDMFNFCNLYSQSVHTRFWIAEVPVLNDGAYAQVVSTDRQQIENYFKQFISVYYDKELQEELIRMAYNAEDPENWPATFIKNPETNQFEDFSEFFDKDKDPKEVISYIANQKFSISDISSVFTVKELVDDGFVSCSFDDYVKEYIKQQK